MMKSSLDILVYGYGNPGREDDGVGNQLIDSLSDWIKEKGIVGVETDSNYQLNIEDAANIAGKDLVVFVDASIEKHVDSFIVSKVDPTPKIDFTMHAVSPGFVLHLSNELYRDMPPAYLLHIKGYQFNMKEELTEDARENMEKALDFVKNALLFPDLIKIKEIFTKASN